ncbi:unnamed protein product [Effrenium voratum]|nr:unnamed protein product [Effrenium voratum]
MLSLSATRDTHDDPEAEANVLFEHRQQLMPLVLRILFAKATRRGKQLEKRSTQSSRRGSVMAYLTHLTDEASLPELFLVLLGSVLTVLPSEGTDSRISSIQRTACLRRVFTEAAPKPAAWCEKLASAQRWGRKAAQLPAGWAWPDASGSIAVDTEATPQRLFGVLQSLEEVVPQLAPKMRATAWPRRLMELCVSVLQRAGQTSRAMERQEQMQITRQCLRAALLRCKELLEQFPEDLEELLAAMRPARDTVEFLFRRLASSGAVQTSAAVVMARSWAEEPALFQCFEEFPALEWLFRVPAAASVKAALAEHGHAGDVVPLVAEIALRLCRGGSLETAKKVRRQYRDVKRELRKRHRDGDDSDEEVGEEEEDDIMDREAQEEAVRRGIEVMRPHVDVLLSSMHELVQNRLHLKGKQRDKVHVATPTELSVLASVSEWCSDPKVAQQLVQLLMTVLSTTKGKGVSSESQLLLVTSLRRLVFVALPSEAVGMQTEAAKPSGPEEATSEAVKKPKPQSSFVAETVARLLGSVKDVVVRKQLAELLVEVEAIRRHGQEAKAYLETSHTWQPPEDKDFSTLEVAHLVSALNSLRRSGLQEPDVDAHVEILQSLADHHLVEGKVVPAKMLAPVVYHCLFLLGCEGVDLGVQHGAERVLCCLADRLLHQVEDATEDRQELLHLTFTVTIQALRRMLKAPADEVFRPALRVLAHYVRFLAPHCGAWKAAPASGEQRGASFGSSPEALLHQDLLPLLKNVRGDDGGDLFGNLLHLQKHRRLWCPLTMLPMFPSCSYPVFGVMGEHGPQIAHTVLKTFEFVSSAPSLSQHLRAKAKLHGLAGVGAEALLATSTRLLSALLNHKDSAEWFCSMGKEEAPLPLKEMKEEPSEEKGKGEGKGKTKKSKQEELQESLKKSTVFDALVLHIQNALDSPALQPAALQLLRRVLLRNKVLSAAVYETIDAVGEIMITGSDKRTAQQCAQIFVDFMLDYPHEPKALQQRMNHLLKNLGYAEEGGRRAVLNCLYLVVLHFPEAQLSGSFGYGTIIFAACAARLPCEDDPTCHQMLHVLICTLLRRITPGSREKLLDLALKWAPTAPAVLAECLGLFVEVDPSEPALRRAVPALATLLKAEGPWQVAYAACRSVERVLQAPQGLLNRLYAEEGDEGLRYLWRYLLGEAFAEERHAWILAVAFRCLEAQIGCWLSGSGDAGAWLQGGTRAYGLMGALQSFVTSARLETDISLAPQAVKALRNLLLLLLQQPELVKAEEAVAEAEVEVEVEVEEVEEDADAEAGEGEATVEAKEVEMETGTAAPAEGEEAQEARERNQDATDAPQDLKEEQEKEAKEEQEDGKDELEAAKGDEALDEPEGARQGSVYDALAKTEAAKETQPIAVSGDVEDRLRRSRVRWLLVRWSHQSQGFQANPSEHFVRLVSWFRLCEFLAEQFPVEVLAHLLRPLLSPAYRCTTAFRGGALPDVVTLDQALQLRPVQRRAYLASLAQGFIDKVNQRLSDAGQGAHFAQVLNQVRKAVENKRQERVQKRRLQPAINPEAAAAAKKAKNRRRADGKKRKLEELIHTTKAGRGKQKVSQSKSLIS